MNLYYIMVFKKINTDRRRFALYSHRSKLRLKKLNKILKNRKKKLFKNIKKKHKQS